MDNLGFIFSQFSEDCKEIIKQLYRVTKKGGVVVWIVGDAVKKGSESGSSFMQAIRFMGAGFKLHDTMIYEKNVIFSGKPHAEKKRIFLIYQG